MASKPRELPHKSRHGMVTTNVRVLEKQGGKSGDWTAELHK
jgi:molybdenum cofactor biosynthesis enzyme